MIEDGRIDQETELIRQRTLAEEGFERYRKPTRREKFLDEMQQVIPWSGLCGVIEPFYPKGGGRGRPPIGVERMLRMHLLQHWFNLSDPAVEEALYDSRAMRHFVGIDLGREPVPDETTICWFLHLMEGHNLEEELIGLVNSDLAEYALNVKTGAIVDATLIDAPSLTMNMNGQRDAEMRQTRKGNQLLRHERAHRGRQQQQAHPLGGDNLFQRARQWDAAGAVARQRDPSVGRPQRGRQHGELRGAQCA